MNPERPIRLIIVDDHPAFRKGLAALIDSEPGMEVVAQTGDGHEAVSLFRTLRPDIILVDLRMPGLSGVEVITELRRESPDARCIVVTTYDADEDIYRAVEAGARSFLLKGMSDEEFVTIIREVQAGGRPLPKPVAELLAERKQREDLTNLEMEVLELLVKGRSNKEIADVLGISEAGVKYRLKSLFVKLRVQDRTAAVVSALRHGIVHLE